MGLIKGTLWWGYLDDSGIIRVKRYKNDKEIENCEKMYFCKGIFDPFEAFDYKHAKELCLKRYKLEIN